MVTPTVMKASPVPVPGLDAFLQPYAHLFRRGTTRRTVERYVTGLLTDLARKNCDTIAEAVAGTSAERLQHMLTDAKWDPHALDRERVQTLVGASPADGILALDDTAVPKQGDASVGVSHQYCGTLGKIANCQVVVTSHYVADEPTSSRPMHWPVTGRLYLPEDWMDAERREKAHIPDDVTFRNKPDMALELVDEARELGVPFRYVVADSGYGDRPAFLQGLEEREILYVCGVHSDFGVRLPAEIRAAREAPLPAYRGVGTRKRKRKSAPLHTVEALSASLPESAWRTIAWREGTKEELRKQFVAIRAHRAVGQSTKANRRGDDHSSISTGPDGWLLAERPVPGERGLRKWYYSNLPADTPLEHLVSRAHGRWPLEQFYEDAKGECGLDNYQGRRWDGFHRHLALAMLSYSFLMHERAKARQAEGSFFPLSSRPLPASRTSLRARLAAQGLDALA